MNEVINAIKSRRSVRNYRQEQIRQEELDLIIEAAIYAPSAHNEQPWHFTVIQNRELINHINNKSKELMAKSDIKWIKTMGSSQKMDVTYGAPTLVVVSGKDAAVSWEAGCSAAIQNMLIAAESLNIGSIWLGLVAFFFSLNEETGKLEIPEGYTPLYGVALGYKSVQKEQITPKRNFNVINYIR